MKHGKILISIAIIKDLRFRIPIKLSDSVAWRKPYQNVHRLKDEQDDKKQNWFSIPDTPFFTFRSILRPANNLLPHGHLLAGLLFGFYRRTSDWKSRLYKQSPPTRIQGKLIKIRFKNLTHAGGFCLCRCGF